MQSYALTVDKFLDHAAKWSGEQAVVTADAGQVAGRIGYAALHERSNRLSGALASLGLGFGDRIATLAWNTQHHLETYYAAMGFGLVCHTLNPRLTAAHLAAMVNEAEDRVLAAAANLLPLVNEILPLCPGLEHVIFLDEEAAPGPVAGGQARAWAYEALLQAHGAAVAWGGFDEETPAGLCYTSGTTGSPKGVLYTHRSNYLHTLRALQADAFALTGRDAVLVAVPMFHANGWGLPFAAPAVGAKLMLPGRHTDGASLARLMRDEKITVAAGVQTVWLGVIDHLDATGGELPDLERLIIGGSSCPDALIQRMEQRLGAQVQTSWGMTELSPLGAVASRDAPPGALRASGRPVMGLDLKLTDADGVTLARQRGVVGHLKVKGASVLDRYFKAEADALDPEGYFDTGDLASLDEAGNLTICGRSKDLIKSGGEWINPAEIEDIVGRRPDVAQVAVIGRPDPKWGERPVLIVEPIRGEAIDEQDLLQGLRGKVADWWLPDRIVQVEAMPLASTGKIDKIRLRAEYAQGEAAGGGSSS
ncbi:AMP-binding protein [Phenylobacterium montanum]|uniref:3-methylmercaptopropionyl-CoA ligase n=1 Tax=Phenylobacterium montanum TaxID=2823693 RepID=A0A975IXF1_9CAUL|nr:AMP-binding protein [Caulobacter sp. S6]QUD89341.1 AMP-binding protein [Caulobacter sp. S6]